MSLDREGNRPMHKLKKNKPLYINVADFVREQIRTQKLKPGEKIFEEELQKQFEVSHITTKKALSVLVDQNLIVRVPGRGTFVTSENDSAADASDPVTPLTLVFLLPLTEKGVNVFTNTYHIPDILIGIEQECKRLGYNLIIQDTCNEQEMENVLIRKFKNENIRGMIIYPTCHEFFSDEIMRLKLDSFPFVIVDQYWPQLDAHFVHSDHKKGSYEATRHLIEAGHRDIGLIFDIDWNSNNTRNRIESYEQCLIDHKLPVRKDYLFDTTGNTARLPLEIENEVVESMMEFITRNSQITAYLCSSMLFLKAIKRLGLKLGEDLSAVFVDDSFLARHYNPALSVIRQQNQEMGRRAFEILLNWGQPQDKNIMLDTELVVRESVGRPQVKK